MGGGYHNFPSRSFFLTVPKYLIGEHFGFSEKILHRKFSSIGGGHHGFVEIFLSHRTETKSFVKEPFCFPENFWYRKIFWIRGGISRFLVEIFLSHSAENFRWGRLRCIGKFRVSKNFMHQRGGLSRFSVENFCHTVPKNFVGDQFGVSENFVYRKIFCIRRGYH